MGILAFPTTGDLWVSWLSNGFQAQAYQPEGIQAKALLMRTDQGFDSSLESMAAAFKGGLDVQVAPGNHFDFVQEPHVKALVEILKDYL